MLSPAGPPLSDTVRIMEGTRGSVKGGVVTRKYNLGVRAEWMEQNRQRILDAAWNLTAAAGFQPVSFDEIAAETGMGRATIFRHFTSKNDLYEAALWHRMSQVNLDRVDAAHQLLDPVDALAAVLRANCELFDQIGDALGRCLEVARTNDLTRQLLDLSYFGRRVDAMSRLARRLEEAGQLSPGWTEPRVADALIVLTSLEAYETLTRYRARPTQQASDTLFAMAKAFLITPHELGAPEPGGPAPTPASQVPADGKPLRRA